MGKPIDQASPKYEWWKYSCMNATTLNVITDVISSSQLNVVFNNYTLKAK